MTDVRFTGTITALATPFHDGVFAAADYDALVESQIAAGIDALVPVGTTGESPTLDHEEHIAVVARCIAAARGRVPVIAGTGSNSTREAVSLTRRAHEAGADGMLVVAPYYNKPSQAGLVRHFSAIAEATDKPVVLYSIPSRCGIEIAVPTLVELRRRHANVAHIKEAGGSVDRVDQIRAALGDAMTILCGDDALTLPFLSIGASGVISVASNIRPREVGAMVRAARANDFASARVLHARLHPLFKALFLEPNPVPVKHVLAAMGLFRSAEVRAPLSEATPPTIAALEAALAALG